MFSLRTYLLMLMRILENKTLKVLFLYKEQAGRQRKLYDEESHNLHYSYIIRVIKKEE
jgi:hypothetical protein